MPPALSLLPRIVFAILGLFWFLVYVLPQWALKTVSMTYVFSEFIVFHSPWLLEPVGLFLLPDLEDLHSEFFEKAPLRHLTHFLSSRAPTMNVWPFLHAGSPWRLPFLLSVIFALFRLGNFNWPSSSSGSLPFFLLFFTGQRGNAKSIQTAFHFACGILEFKRFSFVYFLLFS